MNPTSEATQQNPSAEPATPERICGYLVHPAANLLPDPTPEEFARLVADIEKNGIIEPVVVIRDPETRELLILDGRGRARAWERLGRDAKNLQTVYSPARELDAVTFVLSKNAVRRHLTPSQIAAVYVQANELKLKAQRAQAAERERAGKAPKGTSALGSVAAQVAKATGVGERTVKKVMAVQRVAPEKLREIAAGTTTPNKVLEIVAPKRDPYCGHANPRANCEECCKHGRIKEHCISCSGKGNSLPTASVKPTKLTTTGRPKSKAQIKREEIEERKVEKHTQFAIAKLRPRLDDSPAGDGAASPKDIAEGIEALKEGFVEVFDQHPRASIAVVITAIEKETEHIRHAAAFTLAVYDGFLAYVNIDVGVIPTFCGIGAQAAIEKKVEAA